MADSNSESYFHGLRHISSSFPSIPSLFVGFSTKVLSDSDSVRSPTSPLDFKFFSNLSSSFNLKSPRPDGPRKKWDCSEVGLGIVNSIADEIKSSDELPILQHKHIIFGRQVKNIVTPDPNFGDLRFYSVNSNSLPRNYTILPETKPIFGIANDTFRIGQVPLKPELYRSRSLDVSKPCSSVVEEPKLCGLHSENLALRAIPDKPLEVKESSLPIPVGSGGNCLGPISAGEIESSEDYTCIISYGPNSKTTHIFGDCILECYTTNSSSDSAKAEHGAEMTHVVESSEKADLHRSPSDELLSFCYSCNRELRGREEVFTDGYDEAFCSRECQSKATEQTDEHSSENSSQLSYHEDLLLMGIPFAT